MSDRIFGPSRCSPPPHRTPRRHQSTEQAANSGSETIDTCQVGSTAQEGRSPHGNVWQGVPSVHPQPPPLPMDTVRTPRPLLVPLRQVQAASRSMQYPSTPLHTPNMHQTEGCRGRWGRATSWGRCMGGASTEHPRVTQPRGGAGRQCMKGREAGTAGGTVGTAVTAAVGAVVGGDGGDTTRGGRQMRGAEVTVGALVVPSTVAADLHADMLRGGKPRASVPRCCMPRLAQLCEAAETVSSTYQEGGWRRCSGGVTSSC